MARKQSLLEKFDYGVPKIRLCLVNEHKIAREPYPIQSPLDASRLLKPLRQASEEYFLSLHLNARNEVIGIHEVSHGTLSSSLVHPREVFKAALMANSYAIIVCHNHPSGSTITPSKEDIDTTKQLLNAGKLMGIAVIDHLIVSPLQSDDVYSLRENMPHLWQK
ncbi:MAG: JAB domain-containing protein [Candidatus Obscuribacterales bacterium]|jgi:DNA repair protein RadC|nr:DNA repair protein RadC [Cyanobacteria bacterium SZAS LIN-5]RTL44139.1 MAG: DNA repair protein RadC [Candidatus Melainabacteria bacterium]